MQMPELEYKSEHYQMFFDVYGERGIELAVRLKPPVLDERDKADIEKGRAIIAHTLQGFKNPLVVLHEFAHAYHGYHWPDLTEKAEEYQAEACAYAAEMLYTVMKPGVAPIMINRMMSWQPKGLAVAVQGLRYVPPGGQGDIHTTTECIIHGRAG